MRKWHTFTIDESTARHGSCEDFRFCYPEEDVIKMRTIDIPHIIERLQYMYETSQMLEEEHWDKMRAMTCDEEYD